MQMCSRQIAVSAFFTMENVPGGSLEKFWHSYGQQFVPLETTLDLIKQVCRASLWLTGKILL
jgi:serine/threonine protein kinase